MKVFSSNSLDRLFEDFIEDFVLFTNDPFYTEKILIQTEGIEKWISMKIASHNKIGISANVQFLYPRNFISSILQETGLYSQNENYKIINTFLISEFLKKSEKYQDIPDFEIYNISSYLSDILDQYSIYRPEFFDAWIINKTISDSPEEVTQKEIYRYICSQNPQKSLSRLIRNLLEDISTYSEKIQKKFRRIFIFGISTLPPMFLEFIISLKDIIEINFYIKTPSVIGVEAPNRWIDPDIFSEKFITKTEIKQNRKAEVEHLTPGNSLLLNNAQTARDFFQLLFNFIDDIDEHIDNSDTKESLLDNIKKDILYNKSPVIKKVPFDGSVQIHSAHTPLREVEILYHNILSFFEEDNSLKSNDIIVMTPDINKYAHYIRNIFDNANLNIPYCIADESQHIFSSDKRVLFQLINIKKSRFTFSWVMDLIEEKSVRTKFDISEQDIRIIKKLFVNFRTAWGIDNAHKGAFGIPTNQWENTWKSSIENILMNYCNNNGEFEEVTKDLFNISYTETLGKFLDFFDTIVSFQRATQTKKSLSEWGQILGEYLFKIQDFQHKKFESKVKRLIQIFSLNKSLEVDFDYVSSYFQDIVGKMKNSHLFLNGGVTFCDMLPMRSIPHKVICLIGMNESAYPRSSFDKSLNLMAENPKKGDRDIRQYDRYLFLESIISSQNIFYISYIGQDIKSNENIPPCLLVTELLNYIKDFYLIDEKDIVKKHPLHSFDKRYFINKTLKNYNKEDFKLSTINSVKITPNQILPIDVKDDIRIELNDIFQFYVNPIKYFYKNTVGIQLDYILEEDTDREVLEPKIDYHTQDALFNFIFKNLRGIEDKREYLYENFKKLGILPLKKGGKFLFQNYLNEAKEIFGYLNKNIPNFEPNRLLTFEIKNNPDGISGAFENVFINDHEIFYIPILKKISLKPNQKISIILKASILSVSLNSDVKILYSKDNKNKVLIEKKLRNEQAKKFYKNFIHCYKQFKSDIIVIDPEIGFERQFDISEKSIQENIQYRLNNIYATPDIYKDFFITNQQIEFVDIEKNKFFYENIYSDELKGIV